MEIKYKGLALATVLASGVLFAGSVHAASVTYALTLSNDDADHITGGFNFDYIQNGATYATVKIDDDGTAGLINFTVTLSPPYWSGKEDTNFGIDSFGFNVLDNSGTLAFSGMPTNWQSTVSYIPPTTGGAGTAQDGFGKFDAVVDWGNGSSSNRVDPLTFSIDNQSKTGDLISDYIAGSHPGVNGSSLFAVHIAGFTDQNPLDPVDGGSCPATPDANIQDCNLLTSVWVGGGTVVPVPAAVWLFGSGLLGLVAVARRKKA